LFFFEFKKQQQQEFVGDFPSSAANTVAASLGEERGCAFHSPFVSLWKTRRQPH
jgi:hypothetical protein